MGIPFAAVTPCAEQKTLTRLGEVRDGFLLDLVPLVLTSPVNHRADRDFHDSGFGATAEFILSLAMGAALGADQWFKKQSDQAGGIMIRNEKDIPAPSAIPAIRASMRDEFFPAKTTAPVAAIAGFGMNADLVDKLHPKKVPASPAQVESELFPRWRNGPIGVINFLMNHDPSTSELRELDRQFHLHPFTHHTDMHKSGTQLIKSGDGCFLIDQDDRRLLDGLAGLWCVNVGYNCAAIVEAVHRQMRQLPYYPSFFNTTTEPPVRVAEFLAKKSPARLNRTIFSNSGSEANESALKIIRSYHHTRGQSGKYKILSRSFSYHGVTLAASSMTGLPICYEPFDLPLPGFIHVPGPHPYAVQSPLDPEAYGKWCLEETAKTIQREGADTIAAMFVEPIQGAGGVIPPPPGYLAELRDLLRKNNILFVADEVITAFGRLGHWFASNLWDLDPDIITLAKGITSGYLPLGATMVSDEISETIFSAGYFAHGYTYSAHPSSAAAALANLETIESLGLVERVRDDTGPYFQQKLHEFAAHPAVSEVRGHGLIGALEVIPRSGRAGLPSEPTIGVRASGLIREEGSIVRGIRTLIAMAPPLIITREEIDHLFSCVKRGLDRLWD